MDPIDELLASKPPIRSRDVWWVSKTDVTSYYRCPWAFWMIDSGQLASSSILELPAIRRFIEEGIAFESAVRSTAEELSAGEIPTLEHHGEAIILGTPVVENPNLGLFGAPDGVWPGGGTMAPVEVKSHRKKIRLDEIELAFYWDLMSPWRRLRADPVGLLVFPDRAGGYRLQWVALTDERFAQMRELVDGVRRARQDPPESRICRCLVCSRIEARRVFEECRERGDLTLLSGIGPKYAAVLEKATIPNFRSLRRKKAERVVTVLRNAGYRVPVQEVTAWIHHAAAMEKGEAVVFGVAPFEHSEFIALDLEYDTWTEGTPIWLAGVKVVFDGKQKPISLWADPGEEKLILKSLARLLKDHPALAIVTWNGHSADIPQLRKACERWQMFELRAEVERRHVDLYLYVKSSIRFPIQGLTMKLVAAQLGLLRDPSVSDGLDATATWHRYSQTHGSREAKRLRRELTRYNLDDVGELVELTLAIVKLTAEPPSAASSLESPSAGGNPLVAQPG